MAGYPFEIYDKLLFRFKGGRPKLRSVTFGHMPFFIHVKDYYLNSRIGALSHKISLTCHNQFYTFWTKGLWKWNLFRTRRKTLLFLCTFGMAQFGYIIAGYGTNFYTMGYRDPFVQPEDYSN
jgi:hypothetical protein